MYIHRPMKKKRDIKTADPRLKAKVSNKICYNTVMC